MIHLLCVSNKSWKITSTPDFKSTVGDLNKPRKCLPSYFPSTVYRFKLQCNFSFVTWKITRVGRKKNYLKSFISAIWQLFFLFSISNLRTSCTDQHFKVCCRCPWLFRRAFSRFWWCCQMIRSSCLDLCQQATGGSFLFQRCFHCVFNFFKRLIFLSTPKKQQQKSTKTSENAEATMFLLINKPGSSFMHTFNVIPRTEDVFNWTYFALEESYILQ